MLCRSHNCESFEGVRTEYSGRLQRQAWIWPLENVAKVDSPAEKNLMKWQPQSCWD